MIRRVFLLGLLGAAAPVLAVSYRDSLAELRGQVAEAWYELQAQYGDGQAPPPLCELALEPAHVALRVDIDAGLECVVSLYPVAAGIHYEHCGESSGALFQLGDDGGGMVDPAQLWALLEYLLDDILPAVGCDNRGELFERFAGGRRRLALCDPSGNLLAMPGDDLGAWS